MKIYIQKTGQKKDMKFNGKVSTLLKHLKINPITVITTQNGTLVTEDDSITDTDEIEILQVDSGG